ncbi:MarR family winged helix-turn-helix transcriptional regulator [Geobacter sp. DSM 9736]|uniref:MarR family winged helix-turn-helix transcriptional regulator n=1 Tax=Geobacter sp. DSM 9736 TaxID=1277350 RepID=UPI000B5096A1|nr:MarR family transcriptional regulator [Geobacter sp. DSM 9736]SNB47309.1 transcriptional regulator, MarR family [Geobacter sp. DSM 9736]
MENIERIAKLYPAIMHGMSRIRSIVHEGMDLTYNQYKMLLTISDSDSCSLNQLARQLGIAMSSASEMVDRLVQIGLVTRVIDEENRRQVTIFATQKGIEVILELQRGILDNYRTLLEKLPEVEQERLVQAFEMLAEVLGSLEKQD